MSLIERVQKFDCATPDLSETAVHFHEAEATVEKKTSPVALATEHLFQFVREHLFEYMQCEPKDNDEVAHEQLPSNFAISYEAKMV